MKKDCNIHIHVHVHVKNTKNNHKNNSTMTSSSHIQERQGAVRRREVSSLAVERV